MIDTTMASSAEREMSKWVLGRTFIESLVTVPFRVAFRYTLRLLMFHDAF